MEEVEGEIMEPFELHYSDLVLLSSFQLSPPSSSSSCSKEELSRLESISKTVMKTLGPSGPGILAITGVPRGSELRQTLLPLARKLSLLNNEDCRRILKEHNLGTDVSLKNPNRIVSSFALQLKYVQDACINYSSDRSTHEAENSIELQQAENIRHRDNEFKNLGSSFKELGLLMMEIGVQLARVCDKAIGGKELEQSIMDSCTAKGRLIHYHSTFDNLLLKGTNFVGRKGGNKDVGNYRSHRPQENGEPYLSNREDQTSNECMNLETSVTGAKSCRTSLSNLWQEWHYDYGIFTVLTDPMFIAPCYSLTEGMEQEHPPPDGHIYLQIFDENNNKILSVKSPPDGFLVQVGESADILSNGKLRSTLHSVCRPVEQGNLSRETFVVFLQPAWDKTFSISKHLIEDEKSDCPISGAYDAEGLFGFESTTINTAMMEQDILRQEIKKIVPPLSARLKDGMTFAEFSRQTTKQYYGGRGMQSKRSSY